MSSTQATSEPWVSRKRALSVHSVTSSDSNNSSNSDTGEKPLPSSPVFSSHATSDGKRSRSNSPVRERNGHSASPMSTPPNSVISSPSFDIGLAAEARKVPSPEDGHNDPDMYLIQLVEAQWPSMKGKLCIQSAMDLDYFPTITEEQMSRYSMAVVNLARANNVEGLQAYCKEHSKESLDCFNRFGEGLLNMACRRGFCRMVHLLLEEIQLQVRIRDDYGRTPVHDACWNPEPQLQICQWLLQHDPSLFLVADKRGYTPFQYARQSDWKVWREFLYENRQSLVQLTEPAILKRFSQPSSSRK